MTGLILDTPGSHLYIRSVGPGGILVGEVRYTRPLVINARSLREDWPPQAFDDIRAEHLEALLEPLPELVLLGTGARQRFLPPALQAVFLRRGVGVEVMTTESACRTFNLLVGDGRDAVAALLPVTG